MAKKANIIPMHISDIVTQENIPQKYLGTILGELRNAGLICSRKGAGGGYLLSKRPEDISLVHVLRITDGPIAIVLSARLIYYNKCNIRKTFITTCL